MSRMSTVGSRQGGMGLINLIFVVALVSFVVTLLLKLGPAFMNYWTVRTIMGEVADQDEPIRGGTRGVLGSLERRMDINNVTQVRLRDFAIEKIGDRRFDVAIEYEDRRHLFFNVDVVLMFDHQVEVETQ